MEEESEKGIRENSWRTRENIIEKVLEEMCTERDRRKQKAVRKHLCDVRIVWRQDCRERKNGGGTEINYHKL